MIKLKFAAPLGACLLLTMPALAANVVDTPPLPAPTWTIGIEGTPEFYAINNGSNTARSLADTYFKLSVSHSFENNFVGGLFIQPTFKTGGKTQLYAEASLGYKIKLSDSFTLTPSLALGYTWHDTGIVKGSDAMPSFPITLFTWPVTGSWTSSGRGTSSTCATAMRSTRPGRRRSWQPALPTT